MSVVGGVGGGYYNYGAPAGYTQVTSGWPGQSVSQPTHRGQYAQMGAGAYAGYSMQGGTYSGYQMQGGMQRQQMMMYHGRPVMNQQQVHHPVPQQKQLQGNQYAQQRASTQTQQIPNHQPPTKYFTQQRLNLQTQMYQQQPYVPAPQLSQPQQPPPKPQQQSKPQQYSVQRAVQPQRQQQPNPQQAYKPPPPHQQQQPPPPHSHQQAQPAVSKQPQRKSPPMQPSQNGRPQSYQPPSYQPPERERAIYRPDPDPRSKEAVQPLEVPVKMASSASAATYSTGIKLRELRGVGLQVITEGDVLTSINNYNIPPYGYNLNEIRGMLAGLRGSRVTLGFKGKYGHVYEVDLVRNVRSTKSKSSASDSSMQAMKSRPAAWQVSGSDPNAAPPVYEGFYGGSLAGGSVVDADSYTPSIAIGDMEESM